MNSTAAALTGAHNIKPWVILIRVQDFRDKTVLEALLISDDMPEN